LFQIMVHLRIPALDEPDGQRAEAEGQQHGDAGLNGHQQAVPAGGLITDPE
jgi:hypothetical protein